MTIPIAGSGSAVRLRVPIRLTRAPAIRLALTCLMVLGLAGPLAAQPPSPVAPSPMPAQTPSAVETPSAVPLAEITNALDQELATVRTFEVQLQNDPVSPLIDARLPELIKQIDARLEETSRLFTSQPTLESLRTSEAGWRELAAGLAAWKRSLTQRASQLSELSFQLDALGDTWREHRRRATRERAPEAILERIDLMLTELRQYGRLADEQRDGVLTRLNSVSEQDARVATVLSSLAQARTDTVYRILEPDSPPIWSPELLGQLNLVDTRASLETQLTELDAYARRKSGSFLIHGLVFGVAVLLLSWAGRRAEPWVAADPALSHATEVFRAPVATALLLSVVLASWLSLYPQAPTMMRALLGAVALIPTLLLLRRLISSSLLPILYALVLFYFVGLLRLVVPAMQAVPRLLFMSEMLVGILFLIWFLNPHRDTEHSPWRSSLRGICLLATLAFGLALVAAALGFSGLGYLIGDTVLQGAYLAVVLYAAIQIFDGVILFALRSHPLNLLGVVRHHRRSLRFRMTRALSLLVSILWLTLTLESLTLLGPLWQGARKVLTARFGIGQLGLTLGELLAFGLAVWLALALSRLVRFVLEEDVYTRVELPRGIPYALSTVAHYAVLLLGFLLGVAALGVDVSKFTVLAGAFGVGLGLGLQSIVNNFVSGLILLFERPVKLGDVVQIGPDQGNLRQIGLRASILTGWDGSEVIIPNGDLISGRVTNWTLRDTLRRIEISVGVEYGSNPRHVVQLLEAVAREIPDLVSEPAPSAIFMGFGASSLDFTLRTWTEKSEQWLSIRSELGMRVYEALGGAGIGIPYPHVQLVGEKPSEGH